MLFHSSLRKELARTFMATMLILLTIVITVMLIRTLNMASKGSFSPQDVVIVLGMVMLGYIPIILALTLFLTIVFVLGRMYRDSEMVIWQSAGAGFVKLAKSVLSFSTPIIISIGVLMFFAWPWSNHQITNIGLQFQQLSDLSKIEPGKFQVFTSGSNLRVVFIERQEDQKDQLQGKNVFLLNNNIFTLESSLITATTAYTSQQGEDTFVNLENGQRLDNHRTEKMYSLTSFDQAQTLIGEKQLDEYPAQKARELRTEELFDNLTPANQGELFWRFGLVIASINLALLAISLGYVNPRQKRNLNMLYALLIFVIYFNLLNLGRSWIGSEKLGLLTMSLLTHGLIFVLSILLILKQYYKLVFFNTSDRSDKKNKAKAAKQNETDIPEIIKAKKIKQKRGIFPLVTVRHLFFSEILLTTAWVVMGFLALFFFFDIVEDLGSMDKRGYQLHYVIVTCLLKLPANLYELLPICILIGTILVLARLAQHSEYTILRVSGLSPSRALKLLAIVGFTGMVITFLLGDVIVPLANKTSERYALKFNQSTGNIMKTLNNVTWLRDKDDNYSYAISASQSKKNELATVTIYAFDKNHRLVFWTEAQQAKIGPKSWTLINVDQYIPLNIGASEETVDISLSETQTAQPQIKHEKYQTLEWPNHLNEQLVGISAQKGTNLPIWAVLKYINYLSDNAQDTSEFTFAAWQKLLYPFACIVMVMLALPFAYLHFRSGTISTKVFGGIMIGISFMVINSMFSHLGQLHHWPAIISVGAPSFIYLILSLSVFTWLVRNR